jgi:16S rRNA (guanine1516-N2)-methyltransferase
MYHFRLHIERTTFTGKRFMQKKSIIPGQNAIALFCSHAGAANCQTAAALAAKLGLPRISLQSGQYQVLLVHTDSRLELRQIGPGAPGPVYVDFISGPLAYRLGHGGGRRQLLARAVGLKSGYRPSVLDATAGLGRDGFVLASLGCRVTMIERIPVIGALLEDGLRRALRHPEIDSLIGDRIRFTVGDSLQLMEQRCQNRQPDTIYLDPMYPPRMKNAMVKKEMRLLRMIAGNDADAPALLATALGFARNRVVVKRPKSAAPLDGQEPSLVLRGSNSRYDIYLIGSK